MRKTAAIIAVFALSLGLLGAGLSAQFSDSATATTSIHVGTFAIQIVAPSDGVIAADGKSVTYSCPDIQSSVPASCALNFTVKDVGTIAASNVTVTAAIAGDGAQFSAVAVAPFTLAAGGTHAVAGGISWTELGNGNLGQTVTVTYTISASA